MVLVVFDLRSSALRRIAGWVFLAANRRSIVHLSEEMPPKKGGGAKGGGDKKEDKKEKGGSGGTAVKVRESAKSGRVVIECNISSLSMCGTQSRDGFFLMDTNIDYPLIAQPPLIDLDSL